MVFTRKDGIFMGYVSLSEGKWKVQNSENTKLIFQSFKLRQFNLKTSPKFCVSLRLRPAFWIYNRYIYMGVAKNRGTPKSSILIGFSIINHPFWGTPFPGNTHIYIYIYHIYIYISCSCFRGFPWFNEETWKKSVSIKHMHTNLGVYSCPMNSGKWRVIRCLGS